jgi:dephospho-CoA kinase
MKKIGITGGIGAGKTTVCQIFETLHIPIYYADLRAKRLVDSNKKVRTQLANLLGDDIFDAQTGVYQKEIVAKKIFANPELLQATNQIIHPAVARDGERWNKQQAQKGIAYTLKESALIYEIGIEKEFDAVIVVTAPLEVRIERVQKRNNLTREAILKRISNQLDDAEKTSRAQFVIQNDGISLLIPQVLKIHETIMAW